MVTVSCTLVLVLMCMGSTAATAEDNDLLHQGVKTNDIGKPKCVDLSGTYEIRGKALPGMPEYFIVRALPLTLDGMLGLDLPEDQGKIVTRVKLRKENEAIMVFFLADGQLIAQKEIPINSEFTLCDELSFTIVRSSHGSSEGSPQTIKVITKLSLENDGALKVLMSRAGRGRGLIFFPFTWHEEYGARFSKAQDK